MATGRVGGRVTWKHGSVRILLVNDRPPGPGSGVEVHVARLRRALTAHGHTVEFFSGPPHRGPAKILDVWDPFARRRLARRARDFRPEVVHHHNVLRELSASVLGVPREAATVLSVHDHRILRADEGPATERSDGLLTRAKAAKGLLDRRVARRVVDRVVAVSEPLAQRLRSVGFERVDVVPNFADRWDDASSGALGTDVVYAGRLSREKGLDVLIRAFAGLAPQHPTTRLRLAGDGPDRRRLETLALDLAPGRVVFEGPLDEGGVRRMLGEARVACVPSLTAEGAGRSPLGIIEAMHAGRPVVTTESPSTCTSPRREDRGFVVPWGDIEALREVLDELVADEAVAAQLGAAGRRQAREEHSSEIAVERLTAAYRSAVEHRNGRVSR